MQEKFARSFSVTTVAPIGMGSAFFSGAASGVAQSVNAAQNAGAILSESNGQRDSLLRVMGALFDEQPDKENDILATFIEDLVPALNATNNSTAFLVRNLLLDMASGVSHVTQTPFDIATATQHLADGVSHLKVPADKLKAATQEASVFNDKQDGSFHAVRAVFDSAGNQGEKITNQAYNDLKIKNNSHAGIHASTAGSIAGGVFGTASLIPVATALVTDLVGQGPREISAAYHSSKAESQSNEGVYHQSSEVSKATQNGDSNLTEKKLGELQAALTEMQPARGFLTEQTVTTPFATALVRLVALSLFIEGSRGFSKASLGISNPRVRKAFADATAQNPSGGVDRIQSVHSNLSSLSNLMRLCAENMGDMSAVQTAVETSELLSSRSLSVVISNVSELANALRDILGLKEVHDSKEASTRIVNSPLNLAGNQVLGASEKTIAQILDRIEQENGFHVIPKLNKDMASQINTVASSTVATSIATHSIFSNPLSLATKASKAAAHIEEAQKNEALMNTLPGLTQSLNAIQAATRNALSEMVENMETNASNRTSTEKDCCSITETLSKSFELEDPLLATHRFANSNTATLYAAISMISLLADEMISICRSLTLIDQQRLREATKKTGEVKSKDESEQAMQQMAWDSHSGEPHSASHAVTALRLTLSHTGIALMRIALDLHEALKRNLNTVQQDLVMHTLQRSLLRSGAEASVALAESLLFSTGSASALPASLNGSANKTRKTVHSTDKHLHPEQSHACEESSEGCESTQVTGFCTDLVAGTISNVLKVLAQTGIIGLDTTIKLIKFLEIISLHRDSHIALKLETNDSAHPNGISKNTMEEPSVGSSVGTHAILLNILASFQTLDKSSGTGSTLNAQDKLKDIIDQQIEHLAVLKDDEENTENKGLKEFYKIIIELLSKNVTAEHRDSLVKRLDLGGIALSKYHTGFGAYLKNPSPNAPKDLNFIKKFANENDAQGILRRFIDEAKKNNSLLKSLHDKLPEGSRTKKAQILYQDVFDELFQHYKQIKLKEVAAHGTSRRRTPTPDSFELDIGLRQETVVNAPSM